MNCIPIASTIGMHMASLYCICFKNGFLYFEYVFDYKMNEINKCGRRQSGNQL